ncbi:MAG: PLP-dependent aminotransferase family protein [Aquabacterium sp.]|jgi:DNA-binding transcriptional MocR family regulator|uniref:aminotransferase-like domain-containing protein n=1 Tax=Aquabacterium sp. TaxID=1872578 RepID=UPI003BB00FBD
MPQHPSKSEQVANDLRQQIHDGVYVVGQRLPSIRALVAQHGHSKNCIVEAFDRLVASGEVEARRGAGYFVRLAPTASEAEDQPTTLDKALDAVWMLREQLNNDPQHLAIGHGIPPGEWLADNHLEKVQQRVSRVALASMFQYGNPYGHRPLRDLLEGKLASLSIQARANQIVLTNGANGALDIIVRGLMRPGDVALVDEPGYYPLFGKLQLHGTTVVGVPREADGPNIAAFERLLISTKAKVFFTQSVGQNPTGSDTSPAKAFRLLQIAEKYDVTIVENDALADLKPHALARLCTMDQLRRTVYVGSFTKSVAAALRVGFIAAEAGLAERLANVKMLMHVSTSEYAERTVDAVLRAREYPRQLAHLQDQVERSTRHATKVLTGLGARLFCTPSHTLYLWAEFPWASDSLTLAKALLEDHVALAPGAFFGLDARHVSAWSRYNVGYVVDPRFARSMLRFRPRKTGG